jgi:hypothetical protein
VPGFALFARLCCHFLDEGKGIISAHFQHNSISSEKSSLLLEAPRPCRIGKEQVASVDS